MYFKHQIISYVRGKCIDIIFFYLDYEMPEQRKSTIFVNKDVKITVWYFVIDSGYQV